MRAYEITTEEDYRGSHQAPGDAPLYDLTMNGIYPEDVYSSKGYQYYSSHMPGDAEVFALIHAYRNRPNKPVKIYRAVPIIQTPAVQLATLEKQMTTFMRRGVAPNHHFSSDYKWYDWASEERKRLQQLPEPENTKLTINPGDWVAIDRQYAKTHGDSVLDGKYKILSKTVPAKQVWTNGDSIREWGWHP